MSTPNFADMKWEERPPFGRKTDDGYLQIDSHMHTSMGRKPEELDDFGLTGHPKQVWEHVKHLGYLQDPQDDEYSLLYTFRPKNLFGRFSATDYELYKRGDRFYSVQMDHIATGYWHKLENISKRTIVLKIDKLNRG